MNDVNVSIEDRTGVAVFLFKRRLAFPAPCIGRGDGKREVLLFLVQCDQVGFSPPEGRGRAHAFNPRVDHRGNDSTQREPVSPHGSRTHLEGDVRDRGCCKTDQANAGKDG